MAARIKWIIGEAMKSGRILDILCFEGRMYRICERIGYGMVEERRNIGWLQYFLPEQLVLPYLKLEKITGDIQAILSIN